MDTYLLDTNIISDLVSVSSVNHSACTQRLKKAAAAGGKIVLSVVSIAEIEFGLQVGGRPKSEQAQALRAFFANYPMHVGFDDDSVEANSLIRAKLFELYGTEKGRRKGFKEKRPEELKDRVTGKELGIDERDLLIASGAVQYNYVLVTNDSNEGMRRIREAADILAADGQPTLLRVEDWRREV